MKLRVLIISLVLTIAMGLFATCFATSALTTQPTSVNNVSTTGANTTGSNTAVTNDATGNNGIDTYVTPNSGTGTTTLSATNDIVVESTSNINNNSKDFGFNEILNILLIAVGVVIILLAIAIMFRLK
jgi:hypothetical protein